MKKKATVFLGSISAVIGLICLSGYGYLFKALVINLKKGPLTPSTDDVEKFPSHIVKNANPKQWKKSLRYNKLPLTENIIQELKKTRASSLLIIHNSKLVHEQYWKDKNPYSLTNSFSMAKAILSILVGFAIDDGYLESENQLVSDFLPEYKKSNYGRFLTFRHLMTMQAGLDWEEEYHHPFAENSKQYFVNNLEEQTLGVKMKQMPGESYEYQSVSAQLLGIALKKAIGKSLADYLSEKLWKPLQMEFPAKWSVDEQGLEKAFCCLHAIPRDFAKIGQLIMQDGNWNGKQILSREYCKKLQTPTRENNAFCFNIWADEDSTTKYRFFYGFLGQFIIMVPSKNLVIVKSGFYNRLEVDDKKRPLQVRLLVEEIIGLFNL